MCRGFAETIKDCLGSGLPVPRHYIVPLERFNRQLGSTVGINVAEFEFPAYYNFFFHRQSVNLIVDSKVRTATTHWLAAFPSPATKYRGCRRHASTD